MNRSGLTFAEVMLVALIIGLCLPVILGLLTGQEREVRHSAHHLEVASVARGRLGELEGQLAARGYKAEPVLKERVFDFTSGEHKITITERSRIEPLPDRTGLFRIELAYGWMEPYAGVRAQRKYVTSLLTVDPEVGLRDIPGVTGGKP